MTEPTPLRQRFLDAMSRVASTVNVVTTDGPAGRYGVTVSAMSSVSADGERPILLVCVNKSSVSAEPIRTNGVFCVNILRDDQSYISDRFAGKHGVAGGDKFAGFACTAQPSGSPRVGDPLATFDCRVLSMQMIETHYVFFGLVEDVFINRVGAPLIYSNRTYGTPLHLRSRLGRDETPAETFRLGAFHTLGPYIIPRVLEHLMETGRALDLQIIEGDQRVISEGLNSGAIEAALIYDWDLGSDVENERLDAYKPYVLVADNHPLAAKAKVSLAEIASEPLILLDAPPSGEFFLSLFRERNLEPNVRYRTGSMEMVRGMVGHSLGYSILVTRPATDRTYDGRELKVVTIEDDLAARHMVFAHRRDRPVTKSATHFLAACRELFPQDRSERA